ncbi:MAG: hypothetical protein GEV13_07310 [Rhodospirillales bacterium]|nr:hypothetical protein [Rhodospirillales bacterium]
MIQSSSARYLTFGKFRLRVPRRCSVRVALGIALLVRGVLPPAGPVLLPAALTLLSMDVARLRRWRRRLLVKLGRSRAGLRRRGS